MDRNVVTWFQRGLPTSELEAPVPHQRTLIPGFSFVICTYKRASSLKRFLNSLEIQDRKPDRLVIVDASPDPETEQMIKEHPAVERLAQDLIYFRVRGALQGLTRQRNFGLSRVHTDLVGFFDDDVILSPGCIRELEKTHRSLGNEVVGVGAFISNGMKRPNTIWKLRLRLRMVGSLEPGKYFSSGISTPWGFLPNTDKIVDVDCLPGCAMTWKTSVVHQVGFHSGFDGYALGEDLDFSLRARLKGKLVVAGAARLQMSAAAGRTASNSAI
jgi:GT2 family glycosyltransferase